MGCVAHLVLLATAVVLATGQDNGGSFSNLANFQYLFDRPIEPLIFPKGEDGDIIFQLPDNYVNPRYRNAQRDLRDRFAGGTVITVKPVTIPDLSLPMQLRRHEQFSMFIPRHRQMVKRLIDTFMGMRTVDEFASLAVYCRDSMNPFLFSYALNVALLHRNDTRGAPLPLFASRFPEKYFDGSVFIRAREEANLVNSTQRITIDIPLDWTGTNINPEHRVAYFREDVGVNLCHWHWHLMYPLEGPREVIAKNRRGELFYYFHQQIIARYNFERLSNELARVQKFSNFRESMGEGYYSKLDSIVATRSWPPRHSGAVLTNINRPDYGLEVDIADLERWRDRIMQAIQTGNVQAENGNTVRLDERTGIDILGNMIEANILSINYNLYGNMHNMGHVAMSFCHDPDRRHLEPFAVMGDTAVTMRDPIFFRWHGFVDDMFLQHKRTLTPYTAQELGFNGIRVTSVQLQTQGQQRPNVLSTFWQQSTVDLSKGLDFQPRGAILASIIHLQHTPFTYRIQVQNSGAARTGTVRIFLAPRTDERKTPLRFDEQRVLFIEMDKFQVNLRSGANTITRRSNESAVTIPYEQTFRDLNGPQQQGAAQDQFNYCGCGWPQHMLVPKGSLTGLAADLFVMVSDIAGDRVNQTSSRSTCKSGHSYCGSLAQNYPDRRPMGYPFDRRSQAPTLSAFLTPNMNVTGVTIRFTDETRLRNGTRVPSASGANPNAARAPTNANNSRSPGNANGSRPPGNANGSRPPGNANGSRPPGNANTVRAPVNGNRILARPQGNPNGGPPPRRN